MPSDNTVRSTEGKGAEVSQSVVLCGIILLLLSFIPTVWKNMLKKVSTVLGNILKQKAHGPHCSPEKQFKSRDTYN